jgi:hypothetical protein
MALGETILFPDALREIVNFIVPPPAERFSVDCPCFSGAECIVSGRMTMGQLYAAVIR